MTGDMASPANSEDKPQSQEVREISVFSKNAGVTSPEYDFRTQAVKPDPKAEQHVTESAQPSISRVNQEKLSKESQDQNASAEKVNSEKLTQSEQHQQQTSDNKTSPGSNAQPAEDKTQNSGSPSATTPNQPTKPS